MHSSSSLSIFLCFHFYHHCSPISHKVSSPQMPVVLLSLHFNSPPLSLCLSLSCSLVLSLISSAFVSSLDSVGSTHSFCTLCILLFSPLLHHHHPNYNSTPPTQFSSFNLPAEVEEFSSIFKPDFDTSGC